MIPKRAKPPGGRGKMVAAQILDRQTRRQKIIYKNPCRVLIGVAQGKSHRCGARIAQNGLGIAWNPAWCELGAQAHQSGTGKIGQGILSGHVVNRHQR